MAPLDGRTRAALPDSAFAYVDSKGRRRLPINDAPHIRNALARFEQTAFEDAAARARARQRLLRAARKFGVSTLGFFDGQLRQERQHAERQARVARMARLPTGFVTFLMADVEGSTPIANRLGDDWPALLGETWKVLRRSVQQSAGDEVDFRGDEYIAVFRRPADAVKAAIAIQLALPRHKWRRGIPLRLRIGLHAGAPAVTEGGYEGIVIHTVARVCSAGHGGQILVSQALADLLSRGDIPGMQLRSLGQYRLAGLPAPEALFQVVAEGLALEFPRLRARAIAKALAPISN